MFDIVSGARSDDKCHAFFDYVFTQLHGIHLISGQLHPFKIVRRRIKVQNCFIRITINSS